MHFTSFRRLPPQPLSIPAVEYWANAQPTMSVSPRDPNQAPTAQFVKVELQTSILYSSPPPPPPSRFTPRVHPVKVHPAIESRPFGCIPNFELPSPSQTKSHRSKNRSHQLEYLFSLFRKLPCSMTTKAPFSRLFQLTRP